MVEHTRWNDDRLDDLAALVHANDRRADRHEVTLTKHDEDLVRIARNGDRREERTWQLKLVLVGQVLTLAALIVSIVHH